MPRYIIQPKRLASMPTADLVSSTFQSTTRSQQIHRLAAMRRDSQVGKEINRWLTAANPASWKALQRDPEDSAVTGARVVDMPRETAEKMRAELDTAVVLEDRPVGLIRPGKVTNTLRQNVSPAQAWHLAAVGLTAAKRKKLKVTGAGVQVAVLDTGVSEEHPEISGKVLRGYTFDVEAWNAKPQNPSKDTDGHGTHVAGLICGRKVGVAPGANVVSGVMIPGGMGNLSDFILALEWAARQETISIVNMSAGIPGFLPEMQASVNGLLAVGVLPVFATGNEGKNRTRSPGNYVEPLSVGASTSQSKVASFSSGANMVADNHMY